MKVVCTSCGEPILSSSNIYKCRQCVNHFVCESCKTKEHNLTSANSHTLDKVVPSQAQSTATTASSSSSKPSDDGRESQAKASSKSSSIFNSEDYFYGLLGYCTHCYRIVVMNKEPSFQCQQCPDGFGVCTRCMPLMETLHPSAHTFSQKPLSYWSNQAHDYYHLGIKCDGCSTEHFNGKRYQCSECQSGKDFCANCFEKKATEHKRKYIQNPVLYSVNQQSLASATLGLAKKHGEGNPDWCDPLTGWTKSDADLIIQQANTEIQNYNNRLQQIRKKSEERVEEEKRLIREQNADFRRRMQDMDDDSYRRLMWSMTLN
ncbi:unnamed protein product [Adineta steineri]|uniref:ZZ-type domain-containing protein n=1 Tax=Adineta steineri TaxID=433720 RepID=A0A819G535_9BILA|nr:unnamed protein product [Adineta steineri]CAF1214170.1 unnamed protein product [Adineta steineri]CAF1216356.1 unnamed protein product [Adineta steineri]CAF3690843.1 unnamed protein product [Adineta steineri]CAF3874258.1 unnamed protein product [Adineta steineri]